MFDHKNHPDVMATARHLATLHEHDPDGFAECQRTIAAKTSALLTGKLPQGVDKRTLAALRMSPADGAVAVLRDAERARGAAAVAALGKDRGAVLAAMIPAGDRAKFLDGLPETP